MTEPPLKLENILSLASDPGRWKFVCSALPIEDKPVHKAEYDRWVKGHCHSHSQKEILFCFEGETFEHFAGRNYHCRPGTVFMIDSGEEHASGYPQDGRCFTHLWIMGLGTGVVASFYSQRGGKAAEQRRLSLASAQAECELLARCWNDLMSPAPWMSPAVLRTALASALFAVLFRAISTCLVNPDREATPHRHREIISAVQRHIEAHLGEAEDLDTLAHLAGYSKFHFVRIFKEGCGQTVHGFVHSCRVKKAGELERLGLPRKEIGYALGFSSPSAFSNWLRQNQVKS